MAVEKTQMMLDLHQMRARMMMSPHLKKRNEQKIIQMTKLSTLFLWVEGHAPSTGAGTNIFIFISTSPQYIEFRAIILQYQYIALISSAHIAIYRYLLFIACTSN